MAMLYLLFTYPCHFTFTKVQAYMSIASAGGVWEQNRTQSWTNFNEQDKTWVEFTTRRSGS
jgi:hypothetical protein